MTSMSPQFLVPVSKADGGPSCILRCWNSAPGHPRPQTQAPTPRPLKTQSSCRGTPGTPPPCPPACAEAPSKLWRLLLSF